ncbi:uncharacterized protein ASCRUDRAFT_9150 [Ascoidea rubescens DSM 1968]|uniref:Uncharacterized protein n=1 Tax=Ascoidea rubescens DSM 1968 TaxID=1344418 RepID=A0A1D2VE46_9ASCO|nr:hypothetical protein ASCRUDRAFT_9150 [Ascoidea rubescens DSM 1968]ODV59964.1 hypothetical protein ASCRUDRAFT_9150 [Ascoidea rubescens DSM 1968]
MDDNVEEKEHISHVSDVDADFDDDIVDFDNLSEIASEEEDELTYGNNLVDVNADESEDEDKAEELSDGEDEFEVEDKSKSIDKIYKRDVETNGDKITKSKIAVKSTLNIFSDDDDDFVEVVSRRDKGSVITEIPDSRKDNSNDDEPVQMSENKRTFNHHDNKSSEAEINKKIKLDKHLNNGGPNTCQKIYNRLIDDKNKNLNDLDDLDDFQLYQQYKFYLKKYPSFLTNSYPEYDPQISRLQNKFNKLKGHFDTYTTQDLIGLDKKYYNFIRKSQILKRNFQIRNNEILTEKLNGIKLKPFSQYSSLWYHGRKYLTINHIGKVWIETNTQTPIVSIESFNKSKLRNYHFNVENFYDIAFLSEKGILLGISGYYDLIENNICVEELVRLKRKLKILFKPHNFHEYQNNSSNYGNGDGIIQKRLLEIDIEVSKSEFISCITIASNIIFIFISSGKVLKYNLVSGLAIGIEKQLPVLAAIGNNEYLFSISIRNYQTYKLSYNLISIDGEKYSESVIVRDAIFDIILNSRDYEYKKSRRKERINGEGDFKNEYLKGIFFNEINNNPCLLGNDDILYMINVNPDRGEREIENILVPVLNMGEVFNKYNEYHDDLTYIGLGMNENHLQCLVFKTPFSKFSTYEGKRARLFKNGKLSENLNRMNGVLPEFCKENNSILVNFEVIKNKNFLSYLRRGYLNSGFNEEKKIIESIEKNIEELDEDKVSKEQKLEYVRMYFEKVGHKKERIEKIVEKQKFSINDQIYEELLLQEIERKEKRSKVEGDEDEDGIREIVENKKNELINLKLSYDKSILKLFLELCQEGKLEDALEAGKSLKLEESFNAAMRIVKRLELRFLHEKMAEIQKNRI